MAGNIFNATSAAAAPRSLPDGLNWATAKYVAVTATLSASDVIRMIPIPEGAVILDGYVTGKIGGVAATSFKAGIGVAVSSDNAFITTRTLSATSQMIRFDTGLPYTPAAVSADAYPKYQWATITGIGISFTASVSLQMTVIYATAT